MAHISSTNPWRGSRQRSGRSKGLSDISSRELYTMLVITVFMLIAILLGMYLGWWSLMGEEDEIKPRANNHSGGTHSPERYLR